MRFRFHILLAVIILVLGIAGQFAYDFYLRPYVFAKKIVVAKTDIPVNRQIAAGDIAIANFPNELIPNGVILNPGDVIGKTAIAPISKGSALTKSMLDDDLYPGEDEVIFPIPKEALYSVNGSLRKRDLVDISIFKQSDFSFSDPGSSSQTLTVAMPQPIIEKVRVVFVRSDDNQTVRDTEQGDTNQRETSTGRVATVELLLKKDQRDLLIDKIADGYQLWIMRVSP